MSKYQYLIENSDTSVSGSLVLTLRPKNAGDIFNFKPGQYAMLSFYDKAGKFFINHPFSIASAPSQKDALKFGIKILGKFTQNLNKLEKGSEVEILGPFGDFVFNPKKHQEVVFIAGGVGVTPFISAAEFAATENLNNKITLLYSARTIKDVLFYEDIKRMASSNLNFKPKLKITQEAIVDDRGYCETGYITKETITQNIGSVENKDFFICGPGTFMKAMENNLLSLGVPSRKIHQEAFNVTPNLSFRKNFPNIFLVYGLLVATFLGFLTFIIPEPKELRSKNNSLSLINSAVNYRRDDFINTKALLLNTINSALGKTLTTTAMQQPVITPAINVPISVPVTTPRTRVS